QRATGRDSFKTATCLHSQGYLCSLGQPLHAQQPLQRALAIYRKTKANGILTGEVLRLLAQIYTLDNNRAKAEACWREALAVLARESDKHELGATILEFSNYYTNNLTSTDLKQLGRARALCLHYLPIMASSSEFETAVLLNHLGNVGMVSAA